MPPRSEPLLPFAPGVAGYRMEGAGGRSGQATGASGHVPLPASCGARAGIPTTRARRGGFLLRSRCAAMRGVPVSWAPRRLGRDGSSGIRKGRPEVIEVLNLKKAYGDKEA